MDKKEHIAILPESVKKQIAAGEVVEGPFSVLKELIENSLDAGATRIDVEVSEAGLQKLMVRDNGRGIYREDLPLAIQEHATSKIRNIDDIYQIFSFGFRGEALSSIASIAKVTILSRRESEETGGRLQAEGDELEIVDYCGPVGTTVIVENLFYNTPARKKFIKAPAVEQRRIRETLLLIAVANPSVTFTLTSNQKRQLTLPEAVDYKERLSQIEGDEFAGRLLYSELKDIKVTVKGYFSDATYFKSNRSYQQLYVNQRPVEFKNLNFQLRRAYEAMLRQGQYPVGYFFIEISPELIDVNIHPSKKELKFFDNRYIESLIYTLVVKALDRQRLSAVNLTNNEKNNSAGLSPDEDLAVEAINSIQSGEPVFSEKKYEYTSELFKSSEPVIRHTYTAEPGPVINEIPVAAEANNSKPFNYHGVVFNTYLLYEKNSKFMIMDFHAAHERILYNHFNNLNNEVEREHLVFPQEIELSISDANLVSENLELLAAEGIELEPFSERTVLLRALPVLSRNFNYLKFVEDVLALLKKGESRLAELKSGVAASLACHAAYRAGDVLPDHQAIELINKIESGEYELRCPHGRPFLVELQKYDLEKMFKR